MDFPYFLVGFILRAFLERVSLFCATFIKFHPDNLEQANGLFYVLQNLQVWNPKDVK